VTPPPYWDEDGPLSCEEIGCCEATINAATVDLQTRINELEEQVEKAQRRVNNFQSLLSRERCDKLFWLEDCRQMLSKIQRERSK
jgi:hypothetical protein